MMIDFDHSIIIIIIIIIVVVVVVCTSFLSIMLPLNSRDQRTHFKLIQLLRRSHCTVLPVHVTLAVDHFYKTM